jgi:hypothetical protein
MTEDIKKYRVIMEQAFQAPMQEDATHMDMKNHDHMAQLLIDMLKDSSPSTEELRDIVMGLKHEGHDNTSIHKILDIAHTKLKSGHH